MNNHAIDLQNDLDFEMGEFGEDLLLGEDFSGVDLNSDYDADLEELVEGFIHQSGGILVY